jgi:hypothetical protein
MRAKSIDEAPPAPAIHRLIDAISEFDDDEEVEEVRASEPHRGKDSDVETSLSDPTESTQMLRTVNVSAQLFLSCKRTRAEQMGLTPHVGRGVFGQPEQKRLRQDERDTDSDSDGLWVNGNPEFNLRWSPWSPSSQSPQTDIADAERRRKSKERLVEESSGPAIRLTKNTGIANPILDAAHNETTKSNDTSALDPIVLSDEDEPVLDPENDKFNLANQIPREELLHAMDEQNNAGDAPERTKEQWDRDIVRVKFESYWEQKEEKRRKKVEAEALQRQEMDALKESVKRAQEVGEGTAQKVDSMSTSMAGLAQSVQESIAENNRNMMLQFSQLLQGIGFAPGLQSPYS